MKDQSLPGDDIVSAYLDGEADDDERSRVERDPTLQARAHELRRAASAIGTPVIPPSSQQREAAIAAALALLPVAGVMDLEGRRSSRTARTARGFVLVTAAAAAIVILIAVPWLLRHRVPDQTATPALHERGSPVGQEIEGEDSSSPFPQVPANSVEQGQPTTTFAQVSGDGSRRSTEANSHAGPSYYGSFGPISNGEELSQRAGERLASRGESTVSTDAARAEVDPSTYAAAMTCAERLGASNAEIGELMAYANATFSGRAAIVLIFAVPGDPDSNGGTERVFLVSRDVCQILLVEVPQ